VTTSPFVSVEFAPAAEVGVREPLPVLEPRPRLEWEVGAVASRAPLGLGQFLAGPSVTLRTPGPYTLGGRAAYALTPLPTEGVLLHRFSVQGLAGLQSTASMGPFLEGAAGWSLLGVKFRGGIQGDPTVFSAHLAGGLVVNGEQRRVRVGGFIGKDFVTANGQQWWESTWGMELSIGL
jgi:hypothetical protein